MKQYLAISAIGSDRIGLIHDLSKIIADCGGSISESRMTALGAEFAVLMLVAGNWHSVARIETDLKKLAETSGITLLVRRTDKRAPREDMVPYSVDVVCLDQTGIVAALSGFFASRGIDIAELTTRSYAAAHTGAPMFGLYMVVNVPSTIHLGAMREEFLDLCDQLNLDAILEPVKN
jgi:glycine cleavage system transcriptional repressor